MVEQVKRKIYRFRMPDGEYGNDKMQEYGRAIFEQHPEVDAVRVDEHAGWYLIYRQDMSIIGTANDAAPMTDMMKSFWAPGGQPVSVENLLHHSIIKHKGKDIFLSHQEYDAVADAGADVASGRKTRDQVIDEIVKARGKKS